MTIQWNKVSEMSDFIKALISNTYLPLMRTVREGDYISAGNLYIHKCKILKCTQSGYILPDKVGLTKNKSAWTVVGEYTFGRKNDKLCTTFTSNEEGYDSKTHEKLGQYLRNLRDMYSLDLMPMYNCFSNNLLSNHYINPQKIARASMDIDLSDDPNPYDIHGEVITKTTATNNTIIYKVPIRFNQDYTICIENQGLTTIAPAFLQYDTLLRWNNSRYGNGIDVTNKFIKLHHTQNVINKNGLRFNRPIKFRVDNVPEEKRIRYYQYTDNNWKEKLITSPADYELTDTTLSEGERTEKGYLLNGSMTMIGETAVVNDKYQTEQERYYSYHITQEHCDMYNAIEDHLYMLIQLPKSIKSSIVILEGDYTDRNRDVKKIVACDDIDNLPDSVNEWLFNDNLSLMRFNDKVSRPFSKHLIQYLLWHAVCELDSIEGDGWMLQNKYSFEIENYINEFLEPITGVGENDDYIGSDGSGNSPWWDNTYRMGFFQLARSGDLGYVEDNTGYLTTRIEEIVAKNGIGS